PDIKSSPSLEHCLCNGSNRYLDGRAYIFQWFFKGAGGKKEKPYRAKDT
ncbi:unnamed protein product, partial [marine sediment metagenome]